MVNVTQKDYDRIWKLFSVHGWTCSQIDGKRYEPGTAKNVVMHHWHMASERQRAHEKKRKSDRRKAG